MAHSPVQLGSTPTAEAAGNRRPSSPPLTEGVKKAKTPLDEADYIRAEREIHAVSQRVDNLRTAIKNLLNTCRTKNCYLDPERVKAALTDGYRKVIETHRKAAANPPSIFEHPYADREHRDEALRLEHEYLEVVVKTIFPDIDKLAAKE